jgi:hypothetical protein
MHADTTPEASPDSLIRSVEQSLTGLLDSHPGAEEITVQRRWVIHWLRLLASARMAKEPPVSAILAMGFAAISGAFVMLGFCLLHHI